MADVVFWRLLRRRFVATHNMLVINIGFLLDANDGIFQRCQSVKMLFIFYNFPWINFFFYSFFFVCFQGKGKLLVDVISDVIDSFYCHIGLSDNNKCYTLSVVTIVFVFSYVTLILSCLELMKNIQSAITVVSIMMPALPISSLFWCLFHMNDDFTSEFFTPSLLFL
mgnify:CR=1 FL=1